MYAKPVSDAVSRIENALKRFLESKTVGAIAESWRHDMPEVSARWKGEDGIERNIVFLVHAETVELEVNAWKDDQINRKRHWGNFRVAILTHQCDNANFDTALAALLEFAYKTISTVSIDQLTKVSDLPLATN